MAMSNLQKDFIDSNDLFINRLAKLSQEEVKLPKNRDKFIQEEINIKSLTQLGIIKSKDVAYAIEKKGKMSFKESTLVETKNNQINIIREGSLSKKLINEELKNFNKKHY